ncbi:hypothetical protein A4G19_04720 [Pasteurellaceae bacterium Macca]|nr:hypothetical protein [Pasteurellaceae bacterium Macca]
MKSMQNRGCLLFLLLFLGGVLWWGLSPQYVLNIRSDSPQFTPCIINTDHFALRWRHSVERQLWLEHYQRQGNQLHLYQSWLQTFGAGSPSTEKEVTDVPPGYIGYQHNQLFKELNWTVSRRMEGSLLWGKNLNHEWLVYQQLPDYSLLTIHAYSAPRILLLLKKHC